MLRNIVKALVNSQKSTVKNNNIMTRKRHSTRMINSFLQLNPSPRFSTLPEHKPPLNPLTFVTLNNYYNTGAVSRTEDKLTIKVTGENATPIMFMSNLSVTADSDLYFEVSVLNNGVGKTVVTIGLAQEGYQAWDKHPGWQDGTMGYHSDDGKIFLSGATGPFPDTKFHTYQAFDTVGCGYQSELKTLYFTKNGVVIGYVEYLKPGTRWHYALGFKNMGVVITYNFGQYPFAYDIKKSDSSLRPALDIFYIAGKYAAIQNYAEGVINGWQQSYTALREATIQLLAYGVAINQTNSKWYRLFNNALEVADQRAKVGTLSGPNDPVATICRAITVLRLEAIKQKQIKLTTNI